MLLSFVSIKNSMYILLNGTKLPSRTYLNKGFESAINLLRILDFRNVEYCINIIKR